MKIEITLKELFKKFNCNKETIDLVNRSIDKKDITDFKVDNYEIDITIYKNAVIILKLLGFPAYSECCTEYRGSYYHKQYRFYSNTK